ncbi:DNA replication ATP-dependent helicase/nuclease DNA2-like [Lytechinus variegatus]|uniref:DNA replication ATP-dependent helicase/nuclease DNA2-like n=1 Tax=Lytechinus variegatus TaxID=7654 RepID=UPI001BB28ECF|nr:DNA replication ATP-dependent helicase/nuclease DNA2-like [Lytechinus variegatus]XP_041474083.1 DNA replication ATP-dependent helicase/nuclease DNA2-like [Lytechinus variegatus]XP_041474091.1 DNA replication ATP-dependent helicase/nuclease DNA2-like [Lytechinus variegatus]
MGKPTKTRPPTKGNGQSTHGHQSSLDNFFKKKSELPSPLFTQVISTSQKGFKKQKDPKSSVCKKPAAIAPAKEFKRQPASSLPIIDPQDVLVIPATPESVQSSTRDCFQSPPAVNNQDDSPFSQIIIPDTPDNVIPKKRPFTSLLNHSSDISGSTFKVDDFSKKDSSNKSKYGRDIGSFPVPLLRATNAELPKMKVNLKGSLVKNDRKIDQNCSIGKKESSASGEENVIAISERDIKIKPSNKLSRLSRKGNKLAKSSKEVLPKPTTGLENGECKIEAVDNRMEELEDRHVNRMEIKPAVCRVRNSSKKNTSRLSLSRKVQKQLLDTTVRAVKRSPSRGNSPYSKRFQDSVCTIDDMDHDRKDRVKKSLLEEYGVDSHLANEVLPCPPKEEPEEFISVIPDSCPTQLASEQDALIIPDTCPMVEDTPEKINPQVSGSLISEKVTLSVKSSCLQVSSTQEKEHRVQYDSYTASKNDLTSEQQRILQENIECGVINDDVSLEESLYKPARSSEATSTMAAKIPKDHGQTGPTCIDHLDAHQMDKTASKAMEIDIMQDTSSSVAFDSKDFSTPSETQSGKIDHGTNISSPGTAALLEGLDDSFLDGINLDELDNVQDGKVEGNAISNIDKKFREFSPFKMKPGADSMLNQPLVDLCRYVVTGVQDHINNKKLSVRSMSDQSEKFCILKDTWQDSLVEEGMVVAIHGTFNADGICELNNQSGYLIINPDHLLTGTAVSNSIRCMRRSVLSENFKGLERGNRAMLLGSLLHEVFDQAILKNQFQKPQLMQIARDILKQPAFLCDMYSLKVDEENLLEEVEEYADTIKRWSDSYLGSKPRGNVDIKWPGSFKSENCNMSVSKVTDIEETIWSPRWGVKGKVDLTVEVKIHRPSCSQSVEHAMPLELKTGRETNSIEHRSQLILYSLMLGDLQTTSDLGFLLYLKTAAMKSVPANHMDKRELIHLRNQLAFYLSRTARSITTSTAPSSADWPSQTKPNLIPPVLPEPIRDDFSCKRCAHLQACSSLHKLEGSPTQLPSSVQGLFNETIEHLQDSHLQYFAHWYLLCCLEHEATKKRNNSKNIWCKESIEREKDGECWSNMEFVSSTPKDQQNGGFTLVFRRKQGVKGCSTASLGKCLMRDGDRVVISIEGSRRVAICVGFIDTITKTDIKISSDSQLKKDGKEPTLYRIDKDDSYNSMAASMVNLTKLMKPEHTKLQNIVINKQPPTSIKKPNLPSRARGEVAIIMKDLNEDQRAAIKAVLRSQDYTLIIGMPGTGKTTTIVALVRILVACGMSVLLTSYTHSAVDNILLKLLKYKIDILRLGAQHNIHPELRDFSDSKLMKEASGVSQLATQMERKKVVATTSLGMKHALFTRHSFDVCIVDEASQISQPVCLGPLFSASKFVLVGDQCQLPPLVQSSRARDLGMDESLFQRLVSAHSSSAMSLSLQFRMNSEIMAISNHMVYDGAMRCGNEAVAKGTVSLPYWDAWCEESCEDAWLEDAVDPKTVVSFLNTDQACGPTDEASPSNTNRLEAILVRSIVKSLMQAGCTATQIGVISPYRRQCQLLTSTLADLGSKVKSLEVNTVDKYQGRDKDVIVVSFSHSTTDSQGGSILNDLRRLNVAMTRAKHKLLLIGSLKCLSQFQPVQKLIAFMQQHQLIRNLPHDAGKQTT